MDSLGVKGRAIKTNIKSRKNKGKIKTKARKNKGKIKTKTKVVVGWVGEPTRIELANMTSDQLNSYAAELVKKVKTMS